MNREQRREQLRDWNRLTKADQAIVVSMHGVEGVPESERWRWSVPADEPADECPSCGRP